MLGIIVGVLFRFCYIPPNDLQYYAHGSFAAIQGKLKSNYMCNGYIIIGDMNTRFCKGVREILPFLQASGVNLYSYPDIKDDINVSNDNAEILSTVCVDNKLMCLKTSDKHFVSDMTYRIRDVWISELDVCFISSQLLDSVNDFCVVHHSDLPSDHAPITMSH